MKNLVVNTIGKGTKEKYNKKFKPVFREIELIEIQIYKKKGWLIFQTHAWTQEELLESKHFSKIDSITEKIGNDVENWAKNNQLTFIEAEIYNESREKVDEALHNIKKEIINRPDTFWESFVSVFGNVIDLIMENMPMVNIPLRLFSGVMKALLPASKRKERRLSASR